MLPAQAPFGGVIDTTLPIVPSVRGGPDMALVRLQTTIGAKGITYYERVKGKTISFRPPWPAPPQELSCAEGSPSPPISASKTAPTQVQPPPSPARVVSDDPTSPSRANMPLLDFPVVFRSLNLLY